MLHLFEIKLDDGRIITTPVAEPSDGTHGIFIAVEGNRVLSLTYDEARRLRDSISLADSRTGQMLGYVRKGVEQTAAYEARRLHESEFGGTFQSRSVAARWMRTQQRGDDGDA